MAHSSHGLKFFFFVNILTCFAQPRQNDPCLWYNNLSDPLRSTIHQPKQLDTLLCDRYLLPGWYRFVDGLMPTSCVEQFRCGTQAPIWMNGTIPSPQDGIVARMACVNARNAFMFVGTCCSIQIPIEVRNCGEFVIYNLRNTPGCPMAYCVEAPPILKATPKLIGPEIVGSQFRFACHVTLPEENDNIGYDIAWSFDNQPLEGFLPQPMTGTVHVSYLDEIYWKGNIGKTLRCHVRTYYLSVPNVKSHFYESNGYWGGISVSPGYVAVSERGDEQQLNITCTLPIICLNTSNCAIHLTVDVHGEAWDDIATATDCRLQLKALNWNPTEKYVITTTSIMATNDFIDDGDQKVSVNFHPDFSFAPEIWQGYSFQGAEVVTLDGETTRCYAFSDPHIRGLQREGVYHLYEEGDFVLVKNTRRPFEIHVRSWACVGRGCICAVAIRNGNDVISVDICQNTGTLPAVVKVLSGTTISTGTTIHKSRDGQTFMISFESGNWVRVKDFRSYLNVEVQATSKDYGYLEGICGTFDNNQANAFVSPNGQLYPDSDHPVEFMRSWRIASEESLFTGKFNRVSTSVSLLPIISPVQCFCKPSHGITQCGTTQIVQDPNRLTIKNYVDITVKIVGKIQSHDEPTSPDRQIVIPEFKRPTKTIVNESDARQLCSQSIVNISLGIECSTAVSLHISGFMSSCVQDTLLAGNDYFVHGMVAAFEANCQEAVMKNVTNYKQGDDGRRLPPPEVTTLMCPNQCSLRGRCGDGICRCNPGYTGIDCSVRMNSPPQIIIMRGDGVCDPMVSSCEYPHLIVGNFIETPNLACQITIMKMVNGRPQPGISSQIEADYHSNREVMCIIPTNLLLQGQAITRYLLCVTIDGVRYSNKVMYTVYDSNCLQCRSCGNCSQRTETCLIGDKCWKTGDINPNNPSEHCNPLTNSLGWSSKVQTTIPVPQPPPQRIQQPGLDCKCAQKRLYERWDIWTSNRTGCPCDSSDALGQCACCEVGGCRCLQPNTQQCTQCGHESTDCSRRKVSPEFGIDAWTRKKTGCSCPFNPTDFDCACCQNKACHCGPSHKNQCAPCSYPELCGTKPDVFGAL
ncbi:hypothetical protein LOTGIDRAFT_158683 [Lottia gigantea]|uniref:VWFD domain-containing protein n=1 Tax=Lottia gigantea TaxID=225164 RepID=V4AUU4_LOTGI|nr:hypothetical protein LOTGIDRAFT_158683 [Lottia gigantea]ESO98735.1 hypothetical protein LOTGIDRAFT_158683 [Lottia gigantea]